MDQQNRRPIRFKIIQHLKISLVKEDKNNIPSSSTESHPNLHFAMDAEEDQRAKQLVKNMINSWKVVIFTNKNCSRSKYIKDHFASIDITFDSYDVEDLSYTTRVQKEINRIAGDPLMPKIFIEGKYFGTMEHIDCSVMNETLQRLSARGVLPR